jgi:hypothetical protein
VRERGIEKEEEKKKKKNTPMRIFRQIMKTHDDDNAKEKLCGC